MVTLYNPVVRDDMASMDTEQMNDPLPPDLPYYERLPRLRRRAGLTQLQLRDRILELVEAGSLTLPETRRAKGSKPDPYESIKRAEMQPKPGQNGKRQSSRYPSPEMLTAYAAGLGVDPAEFPEYRLAMARRLLDERAVGLPQALANMDAAFHQRTPLQTTEPDAEHVTDAEAQAMRRLEEREEAAAESERHVAEEVQLRDGSQQQNDKGARERGGRRAR